MSPPLKGAKAVAVCTWRARQVLLGCIPRRSVCLARPWFFVAAAACVLMHFLMRRCYGEALKGEVPVGVGGETPRVAPFIGGGFWHFLHFSGSGSPFQAQAS